jgi:alpha-galactosidase
VYVTGIPKLAETIHNDGNKFGIYVDQGYRTCQDRPGTLDNELKDAQTFAEWGIDYVKNDACFPQTPNIKGGGIHQQTEGVGYLLYKRFFESLQASGRQMFLSIENPELVPPEFARNVSNSRRVGGDIGDQFGSTIGEFHTAPNATAIRAGPGFFNDLDMLESKWNIFHIFWLLYFEFRCLMRSMCVCVSECVRVYECIVCVYVCV